MVLYLFGMCCMLISTAIIGASLVAVRAYNSLSPYFNTTALSGVGGHLNVPSLSTFLSMVNAWFPLDDMCMLIIAYLSIFIAVWSMKRILNFTPEILGCSIGKY